MPFENKIATKTTKTTIKALRVSVRSRRWRVIKGRDLKSHQFRCARSVLMVLVEIAFEKSLLLYGMEGTWERDAL